MPADDFAANNSLSKALNITALNYSYKHPGSTASGGVGVTGATAALVGKFTTTAANAVTDVKLEFFATSATTYRVAIYGDSGSGTPSTTALYMDAADRTVTVAGPVTITLPSPVAVGPGNFYVGIQQTNTTNAGLSFDIEAPIRSGAFFLATPNPPTAWFDFSPGNNFKLNIGLILSGGTYVVTPDQGSLAPGSPGIDTVDVIAVQRHFLNIAFLPPGCPQTAADVNGDLTIDTIDVIAIQRFFLGHSTGIANTGKFQFGPASRTYTAVYSNQSIRITTR